MEKTLRDELCEKAEKAQKTVKDEKREAAVSGYLTAECNEAADAGLFKKVIKLHTVINGGYAINLADVCDFAEKNNLDCIYPKTMDLKEVTLCFHRK